MKVKVVPFDFKYWSEFVEFINVHWKSNHPITNRGLFEWQYTGYGPFKGVHNSILLLVDGKIGGFRGIIPGVYQFKNKLLNGYTSAVWIIDKKLRGQGFGSLMFEHVNNKFDVHCTLGVNVNTAGAIYKNKGYNGFESLNRYVIALETYGYIELLSEKVSTFEISKWVKEIPLFNEIKPTIIDAFDLEKLWNNTIRKFELFGLNRNIYFWNWRYINNIGFKYLFFGDPETIGVVIVRVERVLNTKLKVLRIIELLPNKISVWQNDDDFGFSQLLYRVLTWAQNNGCVAADFQISNKRLNPFLEKSGFVLQDKNYLPAKASLAGLFQPFIKKPSLINGAYNIKSSLGLKNPKVEDTYFVKSDNDMDRTNFWPIIN